MAGTQIMATTTVPLGGRISEGTIKEDTARDIRTILTSRKTRLPRMLSVRLCSKGVAVRQPFERRRLPRDLIDTCCPSH